MFNRKLMLLINDFFICYASLNLVEIDLFRISKSFFFLRTLRLYINLLIKISFIFKKSITKDNDYDIKSLNIKSIEYSRRLLMS